jgi:hypothetical protein
MIVFEPLVYMSAGKKCTERFTLSFPSVGTFTLNSVTETTAALSTITGTAKKTLTYLRSDWPMGNPEVMSQPSEVLYGLPQTVGIVPPSMM